MIKLDAAINRIQHELIHDDEYRYNWKANIAMAIHDTGRDKSETIHEWRNRCAEQAIKYLCADHPDDPTGQLMEKIGH
jgi:hypothetical protein